MSLLEPIANLIFSWYADGTNDFARLSFYNNMTSCPGWRDVSSDPVFGLSLVLPFSY